MDLEVAHFTGARGVERLAIVAIGEGGQRHPPLPASLRDLEGEPLWIDCRDRRRVSRRALVRIAATVLGVSFDVLWRRHRRRRRKVVAAWSALTVLDAAVVGTALWQQNLAEQRTPARQLAMFREWYAGTAEIAVDDPGFVIARTDDLNDDGLIDYFVQNSTSGFCGSGGCGMSVFVTRKPGDYAEVLSLLGDSTPRVRAVEGQKQIIITDVAVDGEPLYSIYELRGERYEKIGYEYCAGLFFEYCHPKVINGLPEDDTLEVARDATILSEPAAGARPVLALEPTNVVVAGVLSDRRWYLVRGSSTVDWGRAGFVPAAAVRRK